MLTGKYPIHLQLQHWQVVPTEPWGLPTQEVLLPQYLRALGYKNVMIGKWHLGHFNNASTPRSRGFDHFYGFYSGGVDYFTHVSEESCDESVYHANNTCYYDFWDNESPQIGIGNNHQTGLLNERAISLIERHETSTPLFMFVALPNAHLPLQVPQELYERHNETLAPFMNEDRRDFAALMLNADEAIANLTIALRRSGMYEKTMMVVLSDNGGLVSDMGGGSNYPLRGEKATLWEGGSRVPAFVWSPLLPSSVSGTSLAAIFCASPSAMADLPTPGSPMRHGLFLVRRPRICVTRMISLARPMQGSSLASSACLVRSDPNSSSVGVLDPPAAPPAPGAAPTASWDSPTMRITWERILEGSASRFSSTRAATPSPSRRRPRRRCSVPM